MSVTVGSPAPVIEVDAYIRGVDGPRTISTAGEPGAWTVLFFYPRDFTFVCPTELSGFARMAPEFAEEEAQLIAASTDSYWSHRAWYESEPRLADVTFPILADTTHELASAYGVLAADGAALRGTFLIDPAGTVRHGAVTDQSVGRSPSEVLRVLQALRTGELCPVDWRPGTPTLSIAA